MFINFKNQSQCLMTKLGNFKSQSALYNYIWYHVLRMSIKQSEILFKT